MSILDNAQKHFEAQREDLEEIDIPEWGAKLYFYNSMNLQEKRDIFAHFKGGSFDLEGLAMALIVRARNADGSKAFRKADRLRLMRDVDSTVLERVVNQIGFVAVDQSEAEKN